MGTVVLALETATEACSVALISGETIVGRHELAPRRHAELVLPMIDGVLAEAGLSRSAIDAIAVGRGPGAFTGVRLAISVAQGIALGLDRPVVTISTLAALALEAWVEAGGDSDVDRSTASRGVAVGASAPPTGTPSVEARTAARSQRDASDRDARSVGGAEAPTAVVHDRDARSVGGAEAPTADSQEAVVAAIDARMGEVYVATYVADADDLVTAISAEAVCTASSCTIPDAASYLAAGTGFGAYRDALLARFVRPPRVVLPELLPRASSIARLALRELARGGGVDAARAQPVYLRDKVALTVAEQHAARR